MKHLHQSWLILDALLGSTVPVISGYIARVIGVISSTMVIPIGKTSTAPPTWRTWKEVDPKKFTQLFGGVFPLRRKHIDREFMVIR
jgi:hypothetical protein